jgi:hypothetical protein
MIPAMQTIAKDSIKKESHLKTEEEMAAIARLIVSAVRGKTAVRVASANRGKTVAKVAAENANHGRIAVKVGSANRGKTAAKAVAENGDRIKIVVAKGKAASAVRIKTAARVAVASENHTIGTAVVLVKSRLAKSHSKKKNFT